jgi:SAM-dependent methyltransferase
MTKKRGAATKVVQIAKKTAAKTKPAQELLKFDFGCGQTKMPGHTGVDFANVEGVDIVYDLTEFPYKFAKDNSASEIFCSHFFEHLDGMQRVKFMQECYRILVPGGKLSIIVPHASSERAFQDYTHKWPPVVAASFCYFNRNWMEQNKLTHGDYEAACKVDFDFGYGHAFDQETANRNVDFQAYAIARLNNAIMDLHVTLTSRKPEKKA